MVTFDASGISKAKHLKGKKCFYDGFVYTEECLA